MKRIVFILIGVVAGASIQPCSTVSAQGRGAAAQPTNEATSSRDEDEAETRATTLAELENWLARLAGRFNIEARLRRGPAVGCSETITGCTGAPIGNFIFEAAPTSQSFVYAIGREATGIGDCAAIGTGSGMHCVFNVPWPTFEEAAPWDGFPISLPWKDRTLDPAIFLFGIDPDSPGIRYLAVDGQSIAEEAWGSLKGDKITFELPCGKGHESYGTPCDRKFWIRVPGGDKPVQVHLEVRGISPQFPKAGQIRMAEYDLSLYRVGHEGR